MSENLKNTPAEGAEQAAGAPEAVSNETIPRRSRKSPYRPTRAFIRTCSRGRLSMPERPIPN